jgi:4'-phosphopantetheinyl transferase
MLDSNTVAVVRIRLDTPPARALLDEDELRRASSFVFERDRRRFIAAHTATRLILGGYVGMHPMDLRFGRGARGKPRLVDIPTDLRFNLSHSGEEALLAVARGREVGVDIEEARVVPDLMAVAEQVFTPAERARLERTRGDDRQAMFFRLWTRKESFIKACGDGMHFPLLEVEFSGELEGAQLLLACTAAPHMTSQWTTVPLASEPGYTAALTVEGDGFRVVMATHEV